MNFFGEDISFGMMANLFDRFTNNLGWLNIPFILYTVAVYTVKYIPYLADHVLRTSFLLFLGFVFGGAVVMYVDYKIIFPSERHFQYNKMEFFEEHFEDIRTLIKAKRESRLIRSVNV